MTPELGCWFSPGHSRPHWPKSSSNEPFPFLFVVNQVPIWYSALVRRVWVPSARPRSGPPVVATS